MSTILDPHDRRQPVVEKLARYLADRLGELREENDQLQPLEQTAHLRGRIAELKRLQDLLATGES